MNSSRASFSYLVWFAIPVFAFFVIAIFLSTLFEPISGDLTRIGHWAERDFGWNKPQSEIEVRENGGAISNPHVLVLGDSFTHPNIWQSYLAESRDIEILSFQYQDVGCVSNWVNWVSEKRHKNVRTVIIQTVERGFVPLFRNLKTCTSRIPKPFDISMKKIISPRQKNGLMLDAGYLLPTAVNLIKAAIDDGRMVSSGVVNVPLSSDRLFSNRKANRLLYYEEDELKNGWSKVDMANSVAHLKQIQDEFEKINLRLVVIVVPDKSSAYRQFFANEAEQVRYIDISELLNAAGVQNVNLLSSFQHAVGEVADLYLPNDTHLSTQGYKLLAKKVADEEF